MVKSDLIWAIREIDPALVHEAEMGNPAPKKHARILRLGLIAAAAVLVLSGTVLGIYVGIHWSELMETYFHVDDGDKALMDSYIQNVYATAEQDGCTFRVTQIMGDAHCMVAALEIQLPDDLRDNSVEIETLRAAAEAGGIEWDSVQRRLELCYGYEETDDSVSVPVFAETAFAPVHLEREPLMDSAEKYMKDDPNAGIYARAWAIDDVMSDEYYGNISFEYAAFFGEDTMLREYDPETNTLTYLLSMHADMSLINRPCTLVISELFLEDLLATCSNRERDEGTSLVVESLLTEPVVLHFDAAYEPTQETYEIYQDDTLIGTMELSPFSANVFFPQVPDERNRIAPNWNDYLEHMDLEVTLTDGSVVTYDLRSSGITDTQFGFFFARKIVDLSEIKRISLGDYTFKRIA